MYTVAHFTFMYRSGRGAPFQTPPSKSKSTGDRKFAEYSEPHLVIGAWVGSGLCLRSLGSELSFSTWGLPATVTAMWMKCNVM